MTNAVLLDLDQWLASSLEGEHLEFKEARNTYDLDKLARYCCALANEGGGKLVLGVTDKLPRKVTGTKAFQNLEQTKQELYSRLGFRVGVDELQHPDGRVLVFSAPSRPVGRPVRYDRTYWMRAGDSLTDMSEDRLQEIFAEAQPDFSHEICKGATETELDPGAVEEFRRRWIQKSGNRALGSLSVNQLLNDAELLRGEQVTYAGLILFGTRQALGQYLPNAEVIFEYRSDEASIEHQQRENFRAGLFSIFDSLWELVNRRNDMQHYQEGLFIYDIPTFDEEVVREALLNAVSHRDYRLQGSIFIRQFPRRIQIVSPGGFPNDVTPENCLYRQSPRNRTIAEALEKCGLVERSGQGFDKIFSRCIQEAKQLPDFAGTDAYQVSLNLAGLVQDPGFVKFLDRLGNATGRAYYVEDLLVLDYIRQEKPVPPSLKERAESLLELGAVELLRRGRQPKYMLSRKFYDFSGHRGAYTRKRGLDQQTNKEMIVQHLKNHGRGKIREFEEVLPNLTRSQIHWLLGELKSEKRIVYRGPRSSGYWELQ